MCCRDLMGAATDGLKMSIYTCINVLCKGSGSFKGVMEPFFVHRNVGHHSLSGGCKGASKFCTCSPWA